MKRPEIHMALDAIDTAVNRITRANELLAQARFFLTEGKHHDALEAIAEAMDTLDHDEADWEHCWAELRKVRSNLEDAKATAKHIARHLGGVVAGYGFAEALRHADKCFERR